MNKKNIKGQYFTKVDIGKVRINNEDESQVFVNSSGNVLMVVCDGMGGHNKGNYASKLAVEMIKDEFLNINKFYNIFHVQYWLNKTIRLVNGEIYRQANENPIYKEMGTTMVLVLLYKDKILVLNIGDSRAYFVKYSNLHQITEDQTYVEYLYKTGAIKKEEVKTREDRHVLMNALGIFPSVSFEISTLPNSKYPILLCSDGLYNNVSDKEIHAILSSNDNVEHKVNTLINVANSNGGSDNIAVALWEAIDNG